ncbi:hypothetical protein ACH3XW_39140 [Acanthocheilonema viteae]
MLMAKSPSVFDGSRRDRIDMREQFYFHDQWKESKIPRTFRRLQYNDSMIIRMKHDCYANSSLSPDECIIMFSFLDAHESPIVQFRINAGISAISMICEPNRIVTTKYLEDRHEYYEFIILFSNVGILLFFNEQYYIKAKCVDRITDISKLQNTVIKTKKFEAVAELQIEESRIPGNWHIVQPISINQKIIIDYYPIKNSIITFRVGDKNGITALAVIVDYTKGVLYVKRDRLDDEKIQCLNFANSPQFTLSMLGTVEIAVYSHRFKIVMKLAKRLFNPDMQGCAIYGHHLSPYDIEQTIIDSTNKNIVAFAHYMEMA